MYKRFTCKDPLESCETGSKVQPRDSTGRGIDKETSDGTEEKEGEVQPYQPLSTKAPVPLALKPKNSHAQKITHPKVDLLIIKSPAPKQMEDDQYTAHCSPIYPISCIPNTSIRLLQATATS